MKKAKIIIPVVCSALLLTGCSGLLGLFSGGSVLSPTFKSSGEEVTEERFFDGLTSEIEKAGLDYEVNGTHFNSFVASNKSAYVVSQQYIGNYGTDDTEKKTTTTTIATVKYDSGNRAVSYETKQSVNGKETAAGVKNTRTGKETYKGHYQYDGDKVVVVDDVMKTYSTPSYVNSSSVEVNYRMDALLYNDIDSFVETFNEYHGTSRSADTKFYQNDRTFTIFYEKTTDVSSEENYTYRNKVQVSFESSKMTLRFDNTYTRRYGNVNAVYNVKDKTINTTEQYGTATIEFKSTSVKAVDLSKYLSE